MKKNIEIKKVICTALSALTLASSLLTTVPAYAFEGEPDLDIIYAQEENGIIRYVDENGDEVDLSGGMLFTQTDEDLPSFYDSRDYGYITPVKSQSGTGDCWAFAAINAVEADSIVNGYTTLEETDFSEAHLAWFANNSLAGNEDDPTYGDGRTVDNAHTCGGNWQKATAAFARWSGVANESEFPFAGSDHSKMSYSEEDRYNTESGIVIESTQVLNDNNAIKQWIMEHGAALFSYYEGGSKFFNTETGAYCSDDAYQSNHAVSVVGWDDNYSAENFNAACRPASDGAWLCKNSWGKNWGNNGYFWLSYSEPSLCQKAGISVQKVDEYLNNYTYNGAHWGASYRTSGTMQAANVFTAKAKENITAVGVQVAAGATQAKITVYKNIPENYTSPSDGFEIASVETVFDNSGYYTVELDEEILLEKGEIFAVAVAFTGLSGETAIPVEMNGMSSNAYSSVEGQSFVNFSSRKNSWKKSSFYDADNVYVQALTECGHEFSSVKTDATCTENGIETVTCTQCGEFIGEEIIPATGHSFGNWITHPYDKETGVRVIERTCNGCSETEQRIDTNVKVVTIDNFFTNFFAGLMQAIKAMFTVI